MSRLRTAARTRAAIHDAALEQFLHFGYEATRLEDVADRLGLTRAAILYHYRSKEDVLRGIVEPVLHAIDTVLSRFPVVAEPTSADQRHVLQALVDVFLEHRTALALILRFTNDTATLDLGATLRRLNERAAVLLGGPGFADQPMSRVRVIGTLAALSGLMGARLHAPLDTAEERDILLRALLDLLRGPERADRVRG